MSDLHKQNLEQWKLENGIMASQPRAAAGGGGQQYRDRAKERREKYGLDEDAPKSNKLKEKYIRAMEDVDFKKSSSSSRSGETKKVGSDNIGNKMLQRMGWKEGLGLGKTNQGRTSIVEVKFDVYF